MRHFLSPAKLPLVRVNRPLSPLEKVLWRLDGGAPMNFTASVGLRGSLDKATVTAALADISAMHPYLRAQVKVGSGGPEFHDFNGGIPLETKNVPAAQWISAVEHEINTRIDSENGPLMRCTCLHHGDDSHHLIFTFHHLIGDGYSGIYLIRDTINRLNGIEANSARIDTVPMDHRLPDFALGFPGFRRRVGMAAKFGWQDVRFGRPALIRADRDVPPGERYIRVIHRSFDKNFTLGLVERSRAEKTTVQGALSAAMCLATVCDIAGNAPVSIKHQSPVNTRADLTPAVGEDLGMFASMAFYRGRVSTRHDFWQLARDIRNQVESARSRNQHVALVRLLPFMYRMLKGDQLSDRDLVMRWRRLTPSTTSLTNLGRVEDLVEDGPLTIESMHFAVSPSALGDFCGNVVTYEGRMSCNFMCPEPTLENPHAVALVDDIVERLVRAVG